MATHLKQAILFQGIYLFETGTSEPDRIYVSDLIILTINWSLDSHSLVGTALGHWDIYTTDKLGVWVFDIVFPSALMLSILQTGPQLHMSST